MDSGKLERVQKCHKNDSRIRKLPYNERLREFSVFSFSERLRSEMITGYKYFHGEKYHRVVGRGVQRT